MGAGFKMALPGVPLDPTVSSCGWVGLECKGGELLGTLLHGERGILSSKYCM